MGWFGSTSSMPSMMEFEEIASLLADSSEFSTWFASSSLWLLFLGTTTDDELWGCFSTSSCSSSLFSASVRLPSRAWANLKSLMLEATEEWLTVLGTCMMMRCEPLSQWFVTWPTEDDPPPVSMAEFKVGSTRMLPSLSLIKVKASSSLASSFSLSCNSWWPLLATRVASLLCSLLLDSMMQVVLANSFLTALVLVLVRLLFLLVAWLLPSTKSSRAQASSSALRRWFCCCELFGSPMAAVGGCTPIEFSAWWLFKAPGASAGSEAQPISCHIELRCDTAEEDEAVGVVSRIQLELTLLPETLPLLPLCWTMDWMDPLGTVTNWAVAMLPSEVLTCTVVPPSPVRL